MTDMRPPVPKGYLSFSGSGLHHAVKVECTCVCGCGQKFMGPKNARWAPGCKNSEAFKKRKKKYSANYYKTKKAERNMAK